MHPKFTDKLEFVRVHAYLGDYFGICRGPSLAIVDFTSSINSGAIIGNSFDENSLINAISKVPSACLSKPCSTNAFASLRFPSITRSKYSLEISLVLDS